MRASGVALVLSLIALATPRAAYGNGVFPAAGQIVVDPGDPEHLLVRTTYGLLTTRDGGGVWDWTCEEAVGYGAGYHPPVAMLQGGSVIAALTDGLAHVGDDGCGWARASGKIAGQFVVDVSTERFAPHVAVAVSSGGVNGQGKLFESNGDAGVWTQAGVDLPLGFLPHTVDVAPSDPARVYASGLYGSPGSYVGMLARSLDRGLSWSLHPIPGSDAPHAPYLGAVHPTLPGTVYVRLDGTPGTLLITSDGGASFASAFSTQGFLRAFALSPDGATVLAGGDADGVWSASSGTLAFSQVSAVAARCLSWTAQGVYACGTELSDGFTVGLSTDEGATFSPIMRRACVRGPLACPDDTPVGMHCTAAWPATATLIQQETCVPDAGTGGRGGGGGAGGGSGAGSATAAAGATATSGVAGSDATSGEAPARPGGCSCVTAGSNAPDTGGVGSAAGHVAALLLAVLRLGGTRRRDRGDGAARRPPHAKHGAGAAQHARRREPRWA